MKTGIRFIRSQAALTCIILLRTAGSAPADGMPLAGYQLADFAGSANCAFCHSRLKDEAGNDVSIDTHWRSTMMANAAKDPLWQAKVSAETARNPALKELIEAKCASCHTPAAHTQALTLGHTSALTGSGFLNPANAYHSTGMDGISCTLCHQIRADNLGSHDSFSGGYQIDTATASPGRIIYGPYPDSFINQMRNNLGYTPALGPHTTSSALCGACHNLYTPYVDAHGTVLGEFPEQMIYSEWEYSIHSSGPELKSCQDCHMPDAEGGVVLANRGAGLRQPARSPFNRHHFAGGNVFMLDMLADNLDALAVTASSAQLAGTRRRTLDQLQLAAARLSITALRVYDSSVEADLLVENLAGHKQPSGFPSRRTWLHVTLSDARGTVFFESGKPLADGRIEGNDADTRSTTCEPHYDAVTHSGQVQIYESIMNDSDGNMTYTLLRGAAYRKDNRLLPQGFNPADAPAAIAVRGAAASDSDFIGGSDTIAYRIKTAGMQGPYTIKAELLHQSAAWSFVQDLAASPTDAVSLFTKLYAAADKTPVLLASDTAVTDTAHAPIRPPNPTD